MRSKETGGLDCPPPSNAAWCGSGATRQRCEPKAPWLCTAGMRSGTDPGLDRSNPRGDSARTAPVKPPFPFSPLIRASTRVNGPRSLAVEGFALLKREWPCLSRDLIGLCQATWGLTTHESQLQVAGWARLPADAIFADMTEKTVGRIVNIILMPFFLFAGAAFLGGGMGVCAVVDTMARGELGRMGAPQWLQSTTLFGVAAAVFLLSFRACWTRRSGGGAISFVLSSVFLATLFLDVFAHPFAQRHNLF